MEPLPTGDKMETSNEAKYDTFLTVTYKCDPAVRPKKQFDYTIYKLFTLLSKSCYFVISPEFTMNGRIHYHGLLKIYDKIKWYKQTLPSLKYEGMVKVETIKYYQKCDDYIKKDVKMMKEILNIDLPIDDSRKEFMINKSKKMKKSDIESNINTILQYLASP